MNSFQTDLQKRQPTFPASGSQTAVYEGQQTATTKGEDPIKKVSIILSKGTLEGLYPGLIMANGARMEGIEAGLFFTFYGLHAVTRKRMGKLRVEAVNAASGIPPILSILPGVGRFITRKMIAEMDQLDIPPVEEFITMLGEAGAHLYACKATVDLFKLTMADFCPEIEGIISVGTFYEKAAGGQIIYT